MLRSQLENSKVPDLVTWHYLGGMMIIINESSSILKKLLEKVLFVFLSILLG